GLHVRLLLVVYVDNYECITGADHITVLSLCNGADCVLDCGIGKYIRPDPAERSTILGGTSVLRVLFGEIRKIPTGLHLSQNVLCFGASRVQCFLIDFSIGSRQWFLDNDLPHVHLLGHAVFLTMLIVIAREI